jgi:hypothetical protein
MSAEHFETASTVVLGIAALVYPFKHLAQELREAFQERRARLDAEERERRRAASLAAERARVQGLGKRAADATRRAKP